MANEETEGQQQRPAGYITIPMVVLNGWVGEIPEMVDVAETRGCMG